MSSAGKRKKLLKSSEAESVTNEGDIEVPDQMNNPMDDEPKSIEEQLKSIGQTLSDHALALKALKDVPTLLANLGAAWSNEELPSAEEDSASDTEADLVSKFLEVQEDDKSESQTPAEDEDMLSILNLSQPASEYGENLSSEVAKSFNQMVSNPPNKQKVDKWKDEYKPPENCKFLGVPRVNLEIWPQLRGRARNVDLSLQQHGGYLSQALVATSRLADKIFTAGKSLPKGEGQDLLKLSMDIGGVLGYALQELNSKRKSELKMHHKEFAPLCTSKTAPNEWLFGDNVVEKLKASRSAANVMKPSLPYTARMNRGHPYKPRTALNFNRPSFQPKGGAQFWMPTRQAGTSRQFHQPSNFPVRKQN